MASQIEGRMLFVTFDVEGERFVSPSHAWCIIGEDWCSITYDCVEELREWLIEVLTKLGGDEHREGASTRQTRHTLDM